MEEVGLDSGLPHSASDSAGRRSENRKDVVFVSRSDRVRGLADRRQPDPAVRTQPEHISYLLADEADLALVDAAGSPRALTTRSDYQDPTPWHEARDLVGDSLKPGEFDRTTGTTVTASSRGSRSAPVGSSLPTSVQVWWRPRSGPCRCGGT